MRKFMVSLIGLVFVLTLAVSATIISAAPLFQHPRFRAELTGSAEVPGPGDPDGSGTAMIAFQATSDVCFTITVSNITLPATGAHIHAGEAGVAGPVVVPLTAPDESGRSEGCVTGDVDVVNQINANPAAFYVNIHTSDYPAGAIRGQLVAQQDASPQPSPQPTVPGTGISDTGGTLLLLLAAIVIFFGIGLRLTAHRRTS